MKKKLEDGAIKCPECSKKCEPTKLEVSGAEVQGWRCRSCGYELISPDEIEKAYLLLQARKHEKVKISKERLRIKNRLKELGRITDNELETFRNQFFNDQDAAFRKEIDLVEAQERVRYVMRYFDSEPAAKE